MFPGDLGEYQMTVVNNVVNKVIDIVFIVVILAGAAFGLYKIYTLMTDSFNKNEENQLLLSDYTTANNDSNVANKKFKALQKQYGKTLKQYDEKLIAYANLEAQYTNHVHQNTNVDSTLPNPIADNSDCWKLFDGESLHLQMSNYQIDIDLSAIRLHKNKWSGSLDYDLHQKFGLSLLESKNINNGALVMHARLFELDGNSEVKELLITKFDMAFEDNSVTGMQWWAPNLKLGVHESVVGTSGYLPSAFLGISASKYLRGGKEMLELFQLGIGVNLEAKVMFLFTPIMYNLGNHIPLISDLWIGPDLAIDTGGRWAVGLSLSTNL